MLYVSIHRQVEGFFSLHVPDVSHCLHSHPDGVGAGGGEVGFGGLGGWVGAGDGAGVGDA